MKRLYRSETDRKLEGICGGFADYFELDSTVVRAGLVILAAITAFLPVFIAYVILYWVIPTEGEVKNG